MTDSSCASDYFVSNLPNDVTEEELKDFFKPTCEVTHCRLKKTKLGIQSCHGYIRFEGNLNDVVAYARREKLRDRQLRIELVENGNGDVEEDSVEDGTEGGTFPPWQQSQRDGKNPDRGSIKQQRDDQGMSRNKWNSKKGNEKVEIINKKGMITKQGHAILNNMHMYDVVLLIHKMQQLVRLSPQAAIKFLGSNKTICYSLIHALFLLGILNTEMSPLNEEDITRMKFHALKNKFQFFCVDSEEEGEMDSAGGKLEEGGASEWRDAEWDTFERRDGEWRGSDVGEMSDAESPPWSGQGYNYEQGGKRPLYERGGRVVNTTNMGSTPASSLKHVRGKNQLMGNRKNASRGVYGTSQGSSYGANPNSYASFNHMDVPSDEGQSGYHPVEDRASACGDTERETVKGKGQMGRSNLYGMVRGAHHSRQQYPLLSLSMNNRRGGDTGGYPVPGSYSSKHTVKGGKVKNKNKQKNKQKNKPKNKPMNFNSMMPPGNQAGSGNVYSDWGGGSRPLDYDSSSMQGNPNAYDYGEEFPSGRQTTGLYGMRGHATTKTEQEVHYSNYYASDGGGGQHGEGGAGSDNRRKDNIPNWEGNDGMNQSDRSDVGGVDVRKNEGVHRRGEEVTGGQYTTSSLSWRGGSRKGPYHVDSETARRGDPHNVSDHQGEENTTREKHLELGKRLIQKINTCNNQRRGIKLIDRMNKGGEMLNEENVIKMRSVDIYNEVDRTQENVLSNSLKALLKKVNVTLKDIPFAEDDLVNEVINEKPILENILISKYPDMLNWNQEQILRVLSIRKSLKRRGYSINGVI
ncbi:hypothetical protein AK88_03662 [Plasmodium fragile]|uniref:RRM domain-containing protein n=1 Tax=Plasmodium fragile TaxID=5857 RepID=A0A0D9QHX1_PLAFR|nr:uncharacterized protein AK88_03662 [Plasmodium fragile]KJP86655.1 hypothetical protein AK88_03662 [Plasmodium fragile]